MTTPTMRPIEKDRSVLYMHLLRRIWAYMEDYTDLAGKKAFADFFDEDGKKKNVYFTRKVQLPRTRFPAVMLFMKNTAINSHGFPNTVMHKPVVNVYFYTLSYDEDDMSLHYYWVEQLDRCIALNRHLTPLPAPNDKDLCVQLSGVDGADFNWSFQDDFVVDETQCEIEVQIKLAGVKI